MAIHGISTSSQSSSTSSSSSSSSSDTPAKKTSDKVHHCICQTVRHFTQPMPQPTRVPKIVSFQQLLSCFESKARETIEWEFFNFYEEISVNARSNFGMPLIYRCIHWGSAEAVHMLIEEGVDLTINYNGTPLETAIHFQKNPSETCSSEAASNIRTMLETALTSSLLKPVKEI